MKEKWLTTMQVYDEYERRFSEARAAQPMSSPWKEEERERIIVATKKMLGYDESLLPDIHDMQEISCKEYANYRVSELRYQTWEHFYGAASLYMPRTNRQVPLVFLCCGHGAAGRLSKGYMTMAHRLTELGMAVMVLDNIGQGDREAFGHWDVIAPFACGFTLQGMIVMETIAIIRHMKQDERFDATRFGACGNSGGGTLTMFLAALAPELSVICSSGYPSEISHVLRKERRHCACNLLPGSAYGPEMWEIYSVFAPKPLLLSNGRFDHLIPYDLGRRNARKVQNVYVQRDAGDKFMFEVTLTKHSWEPIDMNLISGFLSKNLLGITPKDAGDEEWVVIDDIAPLRIEMPEDAVSTDEVAQRLSGIRVSDDIELADVYPPMYQGERLNPENIMEDIGRGNVMRVLAQMECALTYKH